MIAPARATGVFRDRVENGAFYYQHDPRVPVTGLNLVFHGCGFQQEAGHLAGIGRICAKSLFRGMPGMTRQQILQQFDLLGATVDASVSETDFTISLSCFTRSLDRVLALVAKVLASASFPEDEVSLVRTQELNAISAALQNPERVLSAAHEYVIYGSGRLGKIGSREALGRMTRDDVARYFAGVRSAGVLYCTAISDLGRAELESKLGVVTTGRATNGFQLRDEQPFFDGIRTVIVDSPEATNDRLIWSQPGITAADDRRFDLALILDALGSSEGTIFEYLRNRNGWCYGAYGYLIPATTRPGRIAYYADPGGENAHRLIPELLGLLKRFPSEPDFQQRLAQRNEAFKNRYAYQLEPKRKLTNEVNRDRYGIPILDREAYNRRIEAVTSATAMRVIGEVFDAGRLTKVFYGDAGRLTALLDAVDGAMKPAVLTKDVLVA
jgi:predicted Zn-dependent peptidase